MSRPNGDRSFRSHCNNDYIQSWLEKTQRRPAWEPSNERPQDDEIPWRPHDLGPVDTEMLTYQPSLRKHRRRSLDSSIIGHRPRLGEHRPLHERISKRPSSAWERRDQYECEKPQSSATLSPVPPKYSAGPFKKRGRHKTKPDRYETRKRKNTENGYKKHKTRRTKVSGNKRFISSREVMDNFTSDAILTEGRLTVSGRSGFLQSSTCSNSWHR